MAIYMVLEPPERSLGNAGEVAVVIRDGFAVLAFLFPILWLLWHRLWLEGALVAAASFALIAGAQLTGAPPAFALISALISLFVGLEASSMRVASLVRRGWREWGVVDAESANDAELRYLLHQDGGFAEKETPGNAASPLRKAGSADRSAGLLLYSGHN